MPTTPDFITRSIDRLNREWPAVALGAAFLALSLGFRIYLWLALYTKSDPTLNFIPTSLGWAMAGVDIARDFVLAAAVAVTYAWLRGSIRERLPALPSWGRLAARLLETTIVAAILIPLGVACYVHLQLVTVMDTGLTYDMIEYGQGQFTANDMFRVLGLPVITFVVVPFLIFLLAFPLRNVVSGLPPRFIGMALAIALGLQTTLLLRDTPSEITTNPMVFFAGETIHASLRTGFASHEYQDNEDVPPDAQLTSVALIDPAFVRPPGEALPPLITARPPATTKGPWNILFLVLESVGAQPAFDDSDGLPMPMPFLAKLASEGLHLANHYTPCNASAPAGLSIFTGLYPYPGKGQFEAQRTVYLPVINRFLPEPRDLFVVHPASLTYGFPVGMLVNSGFRDFRHFENIPAGDPPDVSLMARHEAVTVDTLMARLDQATQPFFGVYWSYLAHHPYNDLGPEYRIRPDTRRRRDQYYNNLRGLDVQLERIHSHLKKRGLDRNTVLVICGDHGEAFGEHPGFSGWGHGFACREETLRVPMVIHQPGLVSPQRIERPTAHVDIAPTLLDMIGVPWNPSLLQGESLYRPSRRKYLFLRDGPADHIATLSTGHKKIVVNFRNDTAEGYDLTQDPLEQTPLPATDHPEMQSAVFKFRNYQRLLIWRYNGALMNGVDLQGNAWTDELLRTAPAVIR